MLNIEQRAMGRALMSHYMFSRIKAGASQEYERHLHSSIAQLEQRGLPAHAQELRRELPQRTEDLTDTGLQQVIRAIKTGKLKLN